MNQTLTILAVLCLSIGIGVAMSGGAAAHMGPHDNCQGKCHPVTEITCLLLTLNPNHPMCD